VPFIAQCTAQLDWLWRDDLGTKGEWRDARPPSAKLAELTREAMNYIDGVVRWALDQTTADLGDLDPRIHAALLDACRDKEVRRVDVVTLNHDTLLERAFVRAEMPLEDGFRLDRRGVSLWHGFEWKRTQKVRLIKLHGSIDWWRFRSRGPADRIIRGMAGDDLSWNALDRRPVVLVGTFNKMLDYLRAPHIEHLAVFRRALLRCSSVVVAGYSFRDKGVNGLLIGTDRKNRRIVVIDPSVAASEPPSTARPAISRAWGRWLTEGRLVPVRSRFSDTNWPALKLQLQGH